MEKDKYILSKKNEMMPFKSLTMYQYQYFFCGTNPFRDPLHNKGALLLTGFIIEHVHFK